MSFLSVFVFRSISGVFKLAKVKFSRITTHAPRGGLHIRGSYETQEKVGSGGGGVPSSDLSARDRRSLRWRGAERLGRGACAAGRRLFIIHSLIDSDKLHSSGSNRKNKTIPLVDLIY